jgi:hypothetical protein
MKTAVETGPSPSYGRIEKANMAAGKVVLSGWAYLADRQERPHAVFALSVKPGASPRLIAVAFPEGLRQDIFERFHNFEALSTAWSTEVPEAELVDPLSSIICFAYNANTGAAHRLAGELSAKQLRP